MLNEASEKTLQEYVDAFDAQLNNPNKISQKDLIDLVKESGGAVVSTSDISKAFTPIRNPDRPAADKGISNKVHQFLKKYWTVEGGLFRLKSGKDFSRKLADSDAQINTHTTYPHVKIFTALQRCNADIQVIDTYTFSLLPGQEHREEEDVMGWFAKSDKKMQLLVLDPTGKGIRLRSKSKIWPSSANFRQYILEGLNSLLKEIEKSEGRLEVRLMDELPAMHAIILSDCLFLGQHWSNKHSQDGSFLEINGREHPFYTDCSKHFEAIWTDNNRSKSLTKDLCKQLDQKIKQTNHRLEFLEGKWRVCLHDQSVTIPKDDDKYAAHKMLGEIAQYILEIRNLDDGNPSLCTLMLPHFPELRTTILVEQLGDIDFAHCRFTDSKNRSIHLSVRCQYQEGQPLFGHYIKVDGHDMSAGPIILYKIAADDEHLNVDRPFITHALAFGDKEPDLIRHLAFRERAFFKLADFKSYVSSDDLSQFSGVYKMYSYGGNSEGRGIQLNILEIKRYGYVVYKTSRFEAYGIAYKKQNNLYITLTHKEFDYRTGHFVFYTLDISTKDIPIFTGVFAGISLITQIPVAKRVVIEYIQNTFDAEQPRMFLVNTPEYATLHETIRKIFTGRFKNVLGFKRRPGGVFNLQHLTGEWERSLKPDIVFAQSAYYLIAIGEIGEALKMLEWAVWHGFKDLDVFEAQITDEVQKNKILKRPEYTKIKDIITGKYTIPAT